MLEISTLEDITALKESSDVECKLAQGRDGKGALPNDMWETYSAFANTSGGYIFLGLKEKKNNRFELAGIANTQKVIDDLWNTLNNQNKVSSNIIRERWVKVIEIDGKSIIRIQVPPANRKQKPVYINGNPLTGTYKRLGSGDVKQTEEVIRRMLAEQVEQSRDAEILKGFGIDDLDFDSFNAYRNMYTSMQPDHPWTKVDAQEFLYNIGGWAKDRETGNSGLTRAGLLMFGKYRPIMEAFPHYMVDYQERPEAKTEARWIDRITPDGSWSGNVFDFYNKVIRKLTADLKIPFILKGDKRQDDTLVHKALREALVNTIVHADYSGRASVLVVKRPDMFGFRNPGNMRISIDEAMIGGNSDCRNRLLQDMFRFIGLGENAGSGLPKIFDGWKSQHWRKPLLKEKLEPSEQILLELHTLSLVPDHVLAELRDSLGEHIFDGLNDHERLILVTAHIEKTVDHARMMSVLDIHPRDLSALFSGLAEKKLIHQDGSGRGTVYFLDEARKHDNTLELVSSIMESDRPAVKGPDLSSGCLSVDSGYSPTLIETAKIISKKKKAPSDEVKSVIVKLCAEQPLRLEELELLLNRSGESLRKNYIQQLVRSKKLTLKYPTKPNHPQQAYITVGGKHDY
ncbi:MAG: AAA family ATPase [Gammaproteobacteria bacterium]|nr:MAG: AAA family ATPase [Gammaproteobacteria bacterium]